MPVLTVQQLIDNRLTPILGYIQSIPVTNMLCQPTAALTRVQCPYGNWITTPLVRRNGVIITPDAYDATAGTIDYSGLVAGDDVHVSVTLSYFGNTDLTNFFRLALSRFNNAPPYSQYTLDNAATGDTAIYPPDAEFYLCQAAYKQAIDTLMMDLMGWRAGIIFRAADNFVNTLQQTSSQLDNYLASVALTVKGRRNIIPHSVSSGKWSVPSQVSDATWQQYTTIRA